MSGMESPFSPRRRRDTSIPPCAKCGHGVDVHRNGGECRVEACDCAAYDHEYRVMVEPHHCLRCGHHEDEHGFTRCDATPYGRRCSCAGLRLCAGCYAGHDEHICGRSL